jgi:hypothetical protein
LLSGDRPPVRGATPAEADDGREQEVPDVAGDVGGDVDLQPVLDHDASSDGAVVLARIDAL